MTLNEIYEFINIVSLKENNGNLFEIHDMNNAIKALDSSFERDKIREYEKYQDSPSPKQSVLEGRSLSELLTSANVTITTGTGNLPADYGYFKTAEGSYLNSLREIELVTEEERIDRLAKKARKLPERYPICTIRGTVLNVWPKSITPVSLIYYKLPTTPYLDYYVNANDRTIALDASGTHDLVSNESGSLGQTEQTIAITAVNTSTETLGVSGDYVKQFTNLSSFDISGSTGNDGTYTVSSVSYDSDTDVTSIVVNEDITDATVDGNIENFIVDSQTVELVYDEDLHFEYAWKILSILGVRIGYNELVSYSEGMQQKAKEE
jgi:hypothetical protein